jgi:hypothetical protein
VRETRGGRRVVLCHEHPLHGRQSSSRPHGASSIYHCHRTPSHCRKGAAEPLHLAVAVARPTDALASIHTASSQRSQDPAPESSRMSTSRLRGGCRREGKQLREGKCTSLGGEGPRIPGFGQQGWKPVTDLAQYMRGSKGLNPYLYRVLKVNLRWNLKFEFNLIPKGIHTTNKCQTHVRFNIYFIVKMILNIREMRRCIRIKIFWGQSTYFRWSKNVRCRNHHAFNGTPPSKKLAQ